MDWRRLLSIGFVSLYDMPIIHKSLGTWLPNSTKYIIKTLGLNWSKGLNAVIMVILVSLI